MWGGCSRCDNRPPIVSYIKRPLRCVAKTEGGVYVSGGGRVESCQSLFRFTCRSAAMSDENEQRAGQTAHQEV